jgi:hypothetical protein
VGLQLTLQPLFTLAIDRSVLFFVGVSRRSILNRSTLAGVMLATGASPK